MGKEGKKKTSKQGTESEKEQGAHFEDKPYPYDKKLKTKEYEKTLEALQIELLKLEGWAKKNSERIVIFFEGRDAAGKGGTIKRFTEHLNPRSARVVALQKPNDTEQGQWYFQRYLNHFPTGGEIVFFDRSWYNRAGVEPVMGYCTPTQYLEFVRQVPQLERILVESGIHFFKLWFAVSRDEQRKRFEARRTDPLKQWKLSPVDEASIAKWDDYTKARNRMFYLSHTRDAPWTVVRSDDKKRARINAIRFILNSVPYDGKSKELVSALDEKIVKPATALMPADDEIVYSFTRKA
ncbi:MAG TPA: polyphosphate kinase 2 [Acidobacteriota bacterium]|nr:polyphosphate kinase 2 [Acidobacteriota bacterium]